MKVYLIIINLFFINLIYSQNFEFKSKFTLGNNETFLEENFDFSYNMETSIFKYVDLDLGITKSFKVELLKTAYSDDGNFYLISYSFKSKILDKDSTYGTYPFVIVSFDKKLGKITHITIDYFNKEQEEPTIEKVFFTEYGKKYYSEKYFSKQ